MTARSIGWRRRQKAYSERDGTLGVAQGAPAALMVCGASHAFAICLRACVLIRDEQRKVFVLPDRKNENPERDPSIAPRHHQPGDRLG